MLEREERGGGVVVVRIRHGKANAMDLELCEALVEAFADLAGSKACAIVLTGHGRMFSAGVDLLRAIEEGAGYLERFLPALSASFEAVFACPKPVVAAVNGHAIAGGCVLAAAADRRIMAAGVGRMGVPELLVGVPFPAIALEIMREAAHPAHLRELLYTGATFEAVEARARGLVHEVVDSDWLESRALDVAGALAALRPEAFALTKRQANAPALARSRALAEEEREVAATWTRPDTLAAMRTYVERTFRKS